MRVLRSTIVATLLFLVYNNAHAQKEWKMKDIPIVSNLDSLISLLPNANKNSIDYINLLITIERNRQLFNSDSQTEYQKEIDSLSRKIGYTFGKGFANYSQSHYALIMTFEEVKNPALQALQARNQFYSINDSLGVYYASLLYIKNYANYLYFISKNKFAGFENGPTQDLYQCLKDSIQPYFIFVNNYSSYLGSARERISYYYLMANIVTRFNKTKEKNLASMRYLDSAIYLANKAPKQLDYLNSLYFKKAKVYLDDSMYTDAKNYFQITLQTIPCKESNVSSFALEKIAEIFLNTNQLDSGLYYYKKSLTIDYITDEDAFFTANKIADIYVLNKNYLAAFQYKCQAYDFMLKMYEKNFEAQINNYEDSEKIKDQEVKNNQLQLAKKNADEKLLLGTLMLLFLIAGIIFIAKANRNLKKANLEIEKLQKNREQLYSIIAHDLYSPLNSYQDMAQTVNFLLKEKNYTQIENIALKIDKTGLKLRNLMQNLFQWSLSQKDALVFKVDQINLNQTINEQLNLYNSLAEAKNLDFKVSIDLAHIINTDKNHLQTIFRNLIDNAIKNSPANETIVLSTQSSAKNIEFTISNKTTISEEKLNILQSLFDSKQNWQVGQEGIGLGLILIRDFAMKMKGSIIVFKENDMLTFSIQFPIS